MKFSKPTNWTNNFRHDGLLYFAQRIEEMLFSYTSELYSVPIMNTHLLVLEYLNTARLVKEKTIPDSQLKNVMEEFQESFKSDSIIQENVGKNFCDDVLDKLNTSNVSYQEKIMWYLYSVLKQYPKWCISYLKRVVRQEKEKMKIEKALRCFIPELIGGGYSGEYIYYYTKKIFFEAPVNSIEALNVFLDRFDFKEKNYDVYVAVGKSALLFKDILQKRLAANFGPFSDCKDLIYDHKRYVLLKLSVKDFDERKAANQAYDDLNIFFKYYNFLGNIKDTWMQNTGKVIDENGNISFVELKPLGYRKKQMEDDKTSTGLMTEKIVSMLIFNAQDALVYIDKAVMMHNTAVAEKNLSNGFLNFWSVLEILFITDQDSGKIAEIEKKFVPIVQRNYASMIFGTLEDVLEDALDKSYLDELKEKIGEYNETTWLAEVVILKEYTGIRKELYEKLRDYPVVRSRIAQLSKTFSEKESLNAEIARYTQRIRWHIRRLYKTRNAIIHSGEAPDELRMLGEHLHAYVDVCLYEIIVELSNFKSVDTAVIDIVMNNERMLKELKGKGKIDKKTICMIMKEKG